MTTNSTTNTSNLSLKLLIDSKNKKVLFAEASKEVVDFLFTLLQLPLATVIKLLTKEAVVGCLGNLYSSVENLNHVYWQPNLSKDLILNPTILINAPAISGLLPSSAAISHSQITPKLYRCSNNSFGWGSNYHHCSSSSVTSAYNSICDSCGSGRMTREVNSTATAASNDSNNGFVKEVITYMIMDNLLIQPMSTISGITMLNQFNVKDVGVLKETVVQLGMKEGLKLLKASIESQMVLTTVFLA
ncbi:hypothetical protein HN51_029674 [Arachis hypogaea]|uniref:DUF674 family protein n=1 Tax=Arachis hypogaea TaxID=3818 RepID=A0A445BDZ6_ARAHY|nr:uncharacterized protein LOC112709574 [Arachis hypogaea]QHO36355.1 uncharacterized protein DS421_9g283120 [Arachis hypogaea]RYR36869.1 hypothetical protein Ahy_A09g041824 [Arachis hypogaea]